MQATKVKMVNNRIRTAEFRLEQHKELGIHSHLSIYEVANLIDMIKQAESYTHLNMQPTIFQSIGFN